MAKKFKCSKCDRSFLMKAHLVRHQNSIHGRKGGKRPKAAGKARRGRPAAARRVGRPPGKSAAVRRPMVGGGAVQLLRGMQTYHRELVTRREHLEVEIGAITNAMTALGATSASVSRRPRRGRPPGRGRALRAGSLKDYIVKVLRKAFRPMGPKDIGLSVVRAGYKSKAKDLTKAISNTLPELKSIRKVGFGSYRA